MAVNITFSISDPGLVSDRQVLEELKLALESLLGQGQSDAPALEKACTGADLVALGLVTEAQVKEVLGGV